MAGLTTEQLKRAFDLFLKEFRLWEQECEADKKNEDSKRLEELGTSLESVMAALYKLLILRGVTMSPEIVKDGFYHDNKSSKQLTIV